MRRVTICVMCLTAAVFYGCGDIGSPAADDELLSLMAARASGAGDPPLCAHAVNLIAGRTMDIGTVRCWVSGDFLHVLYSADGGWLLGETQLAVAPSRADFPLTKKGNPKIGKFPFKEWHDPPVAEVHYAVDLRAFDLDGGCALVIAAHAEAVLPSDGGGIEREEGAWAEGERFVRPPDDGENRIERPLEEKGGNIVILEEDLDAGGNWAMYFAVDACDIKVNELVINEVFFTGSCASTFYFYDQFVELYNPSADTLYLDGIILTRQSVAYDIDIENVDYVRAIYAYQFPGTPGTGRDHPIAPGEFVVIAADAIDHTVYCNASVDLSGADWECYNPLGNDYDVPNVPNIVNINPSRTTDYMINLSHDGIVIATGTEYSYEEGSYGSLNVLLPLRTVIDGVEYASNPATTKHLTLRVDAGFAGIGSVRYDARSTERIAAGLDTDNSTNDFLLTTRPTPGSQHEE